MVRLRIWLTVAILVIGGAAWMKFYAGVVSSGKAVRAQTPRDFVASGWLIEAEVSGDLDGDNIDDVAVVLAQSKGAGGAGAVDERRRALIILLREKTGQLRLAARADKLLQCPSCGGAFYGVMEAPTQVTIAKGILIVKQARGSRTVVEQTFRFRYESNSGNFWLIGFDISERDRATGALLEQSTNLLTGERIVRQSQFDERAQKFVAKSSTRSTVSKDRMVIERVDYEKYER